MSRFHFLLLTIFLTVPLVGCGGNKDKGINKDKDKPKPAARLVPGRVSPA